MGSPIESIQDWTKLQERLESRLAQLDRLLHHYVNVAQIDTSGSQTDGGDTTKELLEGSEEGGDDIKDILREATKRVKEFKDAMLSTSIDHTTFTSPPLQSPSSQALQGELDKLQSQVATLTKELAGVQQECSTLYKKTREYEELLDQYRERETTKANIERELEKLKQDFVEKEQELERVVSSLKERTDELEEQKKAQQRELQKEKMQKKRELREVQEQAQRELLTISQQHLERELELQEQCKKEREFHIKSIEEMMLLHNKEMKKLKVDHVAKIEECCQNHANLESEWQDKELALQKQISKMVQEKTHYVQELYKEQVKLQLLDAKLDDVQSKLAAEKLVRSQAEGEIKFAKADLDLAEEKLKMGLKEKENFVTNITNLKQEAMEAKHAYTTNLTTLEGKTHDLQKSLHDVTNTCTQNEVELRVRIKKTEELQIDLNEARKNLYTTNLDVQELQQEVRSLGNEVKSKEDEKKHCRAQYESQCEELKSTIHTLQMEMKSKCEEVAQKTKENMEVQLQRQAQLHKENMQNIQNRFNMQWEVANDKSLNYRQPLMEKEHLKSYQC